MIKKITTCRICGNGNLNSVVDLGVQYLTGRFPANKKEKIVSGPLVLVQCEPKSGCGLVQLENSYDNEEMYGEQYGYRSGLNASMVAHLDSKVQKVIRSGWLEDGEYVLDIGSNDGTALNAYPEGRYKLIGIDPSIEQFKDFYREDIKAIPEFFSLDTFRNNCDGIVPKVITSFSMFYDLEDPVEFARDISTILDTSGIWIFEQSYLPSMLNANSFDTICHEHLEYYTLDQIIYILNEVGMHVCEVEFNDINGGSFSIIASLKESEYRIQDKNIKSVVDEEMRIGIQTGVIFEEFNKNVTAEKNKLLDFLHKQKKAGKRVCGLGASTKGNVLLQYYGIGTDHISMIAEVNPDKFGHFTPGTLIPIVPQEEVLATKPDYLLVLPWHFHEFFVNSDDLKGQNLVFPLPNFQIVNV